MLFAANLSLLWDGLPLPERFERASRAGFDAVELWWPAGHHRGGGRVHCRGRAAERAAQYDVYHMQRTEGDLVTTMDAYWHLDHIASKGCQDAVGLEYLPSTPRAEDSFAWLSRWRVSA